jgi:hypothetical protein
MLRAGLRGAAAAIAPLSLVLASACAQVQAQSGDPYPRMAPLAQYLDADSKTEAALARSAAPPAISAHATVLVLTPHGYQIAGKGSNGFTCLVERSWMSPFDAKLFWDWKERAPVCYNAAASRTVLAYTYERTNMVLAGVTKSAILDRMTSAVASGQLPSAAPGSMAYMMSKQQYLTDNPPTSWMSHVMFYAPKAAGANGGASWGANLPGSPVVDDSNHHVNPEPWTVFFVPVSTWSDGSRAPLM